MENDKVTNIVDSNYENWHSETAQDVGLQIDASNEVTNSAFIEDFINIPPKVPVASELGDDDNLEQNQQILLEDELENGEENFNDLNINNQEMLHLFEKFINENNKQAQMQENNFKVSEQINNEQVLELIRLLTQLLEQKDNQFVNGLRESVIKASPNGTIADGLVNILNGAGQIAVNTFKKGIDAISNQFKTTSQKTVIPKDTNGNEVPSNVQYRLNQLKGAEATYKENLDHLWSIPEMNKVYDRITNAAKEKGCFIEEIIHKINNNPDVSELSKAFNESYKNSNEAQDNIYKMDLALQDWQSIHEKLTNDFCHLDPDNQILQEAFQEYNNSADNMQNAVEKLPKISVAEQSHSEIYMKYMEKIKEKIREFVSSVKSFFSNIMKQEKVEDNAPTI
jgi:hypothetical protein